MRFEFSQFFSTGSAGSVTVSGTFTGDLQGNRISDISDIHIYRDGQAFRGNGSLYTFQYDRRSRGWVAGGYLSLDGSDNNIIFIDTDYGAGDASFFNYFFSVTGIGNSAFQPSFYRYQVPVTTQMTLHEETPLPPPPPPPGPTAGPVPEPSAWALLVIGFGALGAAMRRRSPRLLARA